MAKNHGARQQKRMAKQKAKRSAKRSILLRHSSKDPTIRLQRAEKWPVVQALVAAELWDEGIGYLAIARQESEGRLIFASFLVDVYCLGVKNAFWRAGTHQDLKDSDPTVGDGPEDAPDHSSLPGEDRQRSSRVRPVLRLPAPS